MPIKTGIFPWYNPNEPILWWSPDPRFVLFPHELHVRRSLAKVLKKPNFQITFNQAFQAVISDCANTARHGESGTWISSDMIEAYCKLHQLGYAHSAETWVDGQLVGGLLWCKNC